MNNNRCLIMFAKYPEKGKVKTRLGLYWDQDTIAHLYRLFIEDMLDRLSIGDYQCRMTYHPVEKKMDFIKLFGDDISYMPQRGEDLGERMKNAFIQCFSEGFLQALIIGSDSPDLPHWIIGEAFESLKTHGAVIGPAFDGGYYLIGFSRESFITGAFDGVIWGTDSVFKNTIQHLKESGISIHELPPWRDIDRPEDIAALIKDNEKTDFADSKTMTWLLMRPRFSIIIPVANEESVINHVIEHIRTFETSAGSSEIIIVDGDHEGRTIGTIKDKNVLTSISKKGRGNQMNRGAALAKGDILIFLHADARLPLNALILIDSILRNPKYVGGAFDLAIDSIRPVYRLIERIASFRSRVTRIPYGDQTLFFRRDYFNAVGGFADIPIMEDVEIMRRIKKQGDRIAFINKPSTTSARRWEKEGILYCTLRNWVMITLYLLGVSSERLAKWYR